MSLALSERLLCAEVRAAGSSFYWPMRLLPVRRRIGMFALYAFCRAVDDIADGSDPAPQRLAALAEWQRIIDSLPAVPAAPPAAVTLAHAVAEFGIPRAELSAVIEGMRMDAEAPMIAPPWATLRHYCRCVAGAVGVAALPVFGASDAAAERFAIALGEALQLTNILRDLAEDATLGRLYLPAEALAAAGVPPSPRDALAHPALPEACRAVAVVARTRFAEAEAALAHTDRRRLRASLAMMAVYRHLLARLEAADWRSPHRRVGVSPLIKLPTALLAFVRARA